MQAEYSGKRKKRLFSFLFRSRAGRPTSLRTSLQALLLLSGLSVVLAAVPVCGGQPLVRTFDYPSHGFSISFPEGWVELLRDKLQARVQAFEAEHQMKLGLGHYAFQMTNSPGSAFAPFAFIRVGDYPHTPDPRAVQEEMQRDDQFEGVVRTKPSFNEDMNALLITYRVNNTNLLALPMECAVAYFLAKTSVIKLFIFYPPADEPNLAATAQEIIRGVRISDEIMLNRPAPKSRSGLILALLAICGIAVVLLRPRASKNL